MTLRYTSSIFDDKILESKELCHCHFSSEVRSIVSIELTTQVLETNILYLQVFLYKNLLEKVTQI